MTRSCILTVNGGSSSIRCALYELRSDQSILLLSSIHLDRIGKSDGRLISSPVTGVSTEKVLDLTLRSDAVAIIVAAVGSLTHLSNLIGIGHRIVHGMQYSQPQRITPTLRQELSAISSIDPEHLPFELELIDAFQNQYRDVPQIACFDTAFHRSMPDIARILPLPKQYRDLGIERYGFHGLSYSFLMQALGIIDERTAHHGRVIIAHLGNGASLAAIRDGKCIDTTMSFTPASGITMSTRSGDIDPGIIYHLSRTHRVAIQDIQRTLNRDSGMFGLSGFSGDVRDLLAREHDDPHAGLAISVFCYQIKKAIGAYVAALGGLDTLIFSGGIGENSSIIRERIASGLEFIGIRFNAAANVNHDPIISTLDSIKVRVMKTDEEWMIAKLVLQVQSLVTNNTM